MVKPFVFVAALAPFCWYFSLGAVGRLGPDPGKTLLINAGHIATSLLLLVLALPLLARFVRLYRWQKLSRMLGLFAFFYVCVHVLCYLAFEAGFIAGRIVEDLTERPYIIVGAGAFSILLLMALTSTRGWQRRLKKRWKFLHRLLYPAMILVLVHIAWVARSDWYWLVLYGICTILLLGWRLFDQRKVFLPGR